MNDLLAHIYRDFIHIIDKVLYILPCNLIVIGVPIDITPVPYRFNVLSGDPHKHLIELNSRLLYCIGGCGLDRIDGLLDIQDDPSFNALGGGLTDSQDFQLSQVIQPSYQAYDFGRADINRSYDFFICCHSLNV